MLSDSCSPGTRGRGLGVRMVVVVQMGTVVSRCEAVQLVVVVQIQVVVIEAGRPEVARLCRIRLGEAGGHVAGQGSRGSTFTCLMLLGLVVVLLLLLVTVVVMVHGSSRVR